MDCGLRAGLLLARCELLCGLKFRLHRVDAVAQETVEFFELLVAVHLCNRNRLADAHRNTLALLVDRLIDQVCRPQHRVDPAQAMETLRASAFKIDRQHRAVARPDELDDGHGPRTVFDDVLLPSRALFPGLISSYRPRRE